MKEDDYIRVAVSGRTIYKAVSNYFKDNPFEGVIKDYLQMNVISPATLEKISEAHIRSEVRKIDFDKLIREEIRKVVKNVIEEKLTDVFSDALRKKER